MSASAWLHVHLYTADGENRVFPDGGILWEDGVIAAVGESAEIEKRAAAAGAEVDDGAGK